VGVVFWGAFTRYVLNSPAFWAEELGRLTLVWLAFVGGGLAAWKGSHFRVDLVYRRLAPGLRVLVDGFNAGLIGGFVLVLFGPTLDLAATRQLVASPWLGVSEAVLYILPAALGLVTMGLGQLGTFFRLPFPGKGAAFLTGAMLVALVTVFRAQASLLLGQVNLFLGLMVLLCLLLALHVPIAFALGVSASLYLLDLGIMPAPVIPQRMVAGVNSFVLLAVPLFIFAGAVMDAGGISRRVADFARGLVGHLKGGLAIVSLVAEYLFSGISGSTTADVAAIGSVLIPPMRKAGYPRAEAAAIVGAAAAMGILVPPSIHMVVLSTLVEVSVAALFLAGFLPAAFLALCLAALIYLKASVHGWPREPRVPAAETIRRGLKAMPPMLTAFIIFGGIFSGAVTLTESAVLALVYAVILAAGIYREVAPGQLWRLTVESATVVSAVMWLLANATVFGWLITAQRIPHRLAEDITRLAGHPALFLALTALVYLVFSDLLEGLPALVIFSSILFPTAVLLGINPVHFGVISIAALGIGFFLPPAGLGLILAAGIAEASPGEAWRSFWPYVLVLLAGLLGLILLPDITLLLPRLFGFPGV
jgi:tripartite ATP-independent transporter DctM subunit